VTPEWLHPREELRPIVVKKDTGKMNAPNGPGTLKRPPRPEAGAKLLKKSISLLRGKAAPGRKISSGWSLLSIVRRTRAGKAPFYWVPRRLWSA
jgi:hypothetical protein